MEWLASIDGEAVAHARAFPGPRGLLLDGGATAAERSRPRRLPRADRSTLGGSRARGTPALVVQAQEMSRPILERCGFEPVCTMYEVEHDPL